MNPVSRERKWVGLLADWQSEMQQLHQAHAGQWADLGLPEVADLRVREPDPFGVAELERVWDDVIDPELLAFLSVSDGWPLWLGSYLASAAPAKKIGLLRNTYPEAFDIAVSSAPSLRKITSHEVLLSKDELRSALVVSEPDARELVLSLTSHETCLYFFDGMRVFRSFYDYMSYQKAATRAWVVDMLQ